MGADGSSEVVGEFHSHLYPFAEGGPAMFTPQAEIGGPEAALFVDAAWSPVTTGLLDDLRDWGVPEPAVAPVADPAVAPVADPAPAPAAAPVPWLLIVVGIVAIGGVLHLVRRRSPAV
jgi:hypothetical protein